MTDFYSVPPPPTLSYPKGRPRSLAYRNRRYLLGRFGAPPWAAEVCEEIEERHSGIKVMWFPENRIKGWEKPAGWYGWRAGELPLVKNAHAGYDRRREWYGETAAELIAQLP